MGLLESEPGQSELAHPGVATSPSIPERREIEYLVHERDLPRLREVLSAHMAPGEASARDGIPVTSLYYDTQNLRFYWEQVEEREHRRTLRVRRYGPPGRTAERTPVYIEFEQRVGQVAQKRRIQLSYANAMRLCNARLPIEPEPAVATLLGEVGALISSLDLCPTVITEYVRESFVDADRGLRVNIDRKVQGRDRDLDLASTSAHHFVIPPHLCILTIESEMPVPQWIINSTVGMRELRISKYCQTVETFGLAPRSRAHVIGDRLTRTPPGHSGRSNAG